MSYKNTMGEAISHNIPGQKFLFYFLQKKDHLKTVISVLDIA